jgi:hypothetical protein
MATRDSPALYEGTVTRLRVEVESAGAVVVRFVLASDDGDRRPVEMRGERVLGVIDEGDRIAIAEARDDRPDTTLRPSTVTNLTTGGTVELEQPSRMRRAGRAIGVREIRSAAISAGVGGLIAVVVAQLFDDSGPPQGIDVAPEDEPSLAAVILVLVGVFALLAGLWLLVRRRLPGRLPKWSPLVGLAVGLFAVGIALA